MAERILSVREVIADLNSHRYPRIERVSDWLDDQKERVLQGQGYPTREELKVRGLDESKFLDHIGFSIKWAGGAAHSETPTFLDDKLTELNRLGANVIKGRVQVAMIVHTSLSYHPSHDADDPRLALQTRESLLLMQSTLDTRGRLASDVEHRELSCGISNGCSYNTRQQLEDNVNRVSQEAKKHSLDLVLHPAEIAIGVRNPDQELITRAAGGFPIVAYDAYFGINNVRDTRFFAHPSVRSGETTTLAEPVSGFTTSNGLNDKLRELMDTGDIVIKINCLDRRAETEPSESIEPVNLDKLSQSFRERHGLCRSLASAEPLQCCLQGLGHTERDLMVFLDGNAGLTRNYALWEQFHDAAIVRRGEGFFSIAPTDLAIIALPIYSLKQRYIRELVEAQFKQLGSNLNREVYDRTFGRSTWVSYESTDGQNIEMDYPRGIHVLLPDSLRDSHYEEVSLGTGQRRTGQEDLFRPTTGIPLFCPDAPIGHPNPAPSKIRLGPVTFEYVPFSTRAAGIYPKDFLKK